MGEIIDIHELMGGKEAEKVTKLEFEARKIYLEGYMAAVHKLHSLELELEELEHNYGPSARGLSGMPGSSKKSDGSGRIIRNMENKRKLIAVIKREADAIEKQRKEIAAVIDTTISGNQQSVLRYRYINDMDVGQIADTMHYSYKQILNLHKSAVQRIKPPRWKIGKIKAKLIEFHPEWSEIQAKEA